jgi:hypothetical protein
MDNSDCTDTSLTIYEEFNGSHNRNLFDNYHYRRLKLAEDLLLPRVEKGEILAIQSLLKLTSDAINDGARINKKIANYLSTALNKIFSGENADLAFGISRSRGEKNIRLSRQKSFSIAFFIEDSKKASLEEMFDIAGEKFCVSSETARKAWKKNYAEARKIVALNKKNFPR